MVFPENITSVRPRDKVLEIGPGSSPHSLSNVFLELHFDDIQEKIAHRGGELKEAKFDNRPIYYYDGGKFPFEDNQFDYVICSHVLEHVEDPAYFLSEVFRVGSGRGYVEYPLITYEYLYNFKVHLHFIKFEFERHTLWYLPKRDTEFSQFSQVQALFYRTLECGWDDLCAANKKLFYEGFEFNQPFLVEKAESLDKLLPPRSLVKPKRLVRVLLTRLINKLEL